MSSQRHRKASFEDESSTQQMDHLEHIKLSLTIFKQALTFQPPCRLLVKIRGASFRPWLTHKPMPDKKNFAGKVTSPQRLIPANSTAGRRTQDRQVRGRRADEMAAPKWIHPAGVVSLLAAPVPERAG